MRIVFMGTPDFAVPSLISLRQGSHDIAAVVTQPDRPRGRGQKLEAAPVKKAAVHAGLAVLQPAKIREAAAVEAIRALAPDLIVTAAYGQILPPALLAVPVYGCVNVHASLLPRYRGAAPIHWAIIRGETVTGVTIMYMDAGMDTGDIILQRSTHIGPDETTGDVHDRLAAAGAELLAEAIARIASGEAPRRPQAADEATYAPLLTRADEVIDWKQPAAAVHNLIRGMNPWPGAYTLHSRGILKIYQSERQPEEETNADRAAVPGTVLHVSNGRGLVVATGRGSLLVKTVKPENGKMMAADAYARGYRLTAGTVLGAPGGNGSRL